MERVRWRHGEIERVRWREGVEFCLIFNLVGSVE